MMGLFSAPAVIREPGLASTAVISMAAVGHRLERTSRVTCCDARALSRATEIWGLFWMANVSACFNESGVPLPTCGAAGLCGVVGPCVAPGIPVEEPAPAWARMNKSVLALGIGAEGKLCAVCPHM